MRHPQPLAQQATARVFKVQLLQHRLFKTPDNLIQPAVQRLRRLRIAQPRSLRSRQLWAASFGLVAFLALAGFALDHAFQNTALSGLRDRLHSYALAYASSDFARDGSVIPPWDPPDPRFRRPGSGLYAQIVLESGHWESDSAQGPRLPQGSRS